MKKKSRIMATITAVAVAAAGFFVPAQFKQDNGFIIQAGAEDDFNTNGGLKLGFIKNYGTVEQEIIEDDFDFDILAEGDYIRLLIEVPNLTGKLTEEQPYLDANGQPAVFVGTDRGLDVADMTISYDPSAFELIQWYDSWGTSDHGWEDAGELLGGSAGETNADTTNGLLRLKVTNNGKRKVNKLFFNEDGTGDTLQAIFKVSNGAVINREYAFTILDTAANPLDFSFWTDAEGTNARRIWKPLDDRLTLTAKVAKSITGVINNYKEDEVPTVYMYQSALWDGTYMIKTTALQRENDSVYDPEAGTITFTFRGVPDDESTYAIQIDKWCRYKNGTKWTDNGYKFRIADAPISVDLWLYGDVNHDGSIGALDATTILKYLVGKKNGNKEFISTDDEKKIANVLSGGDNAAIDDNLNTRDATQILRHTSKQQSIISVKNADIGQELQALIV